MNIEMNIEGLKVIFSEATIDALIEHQCHLSAGSKWLARNDPRCKYEQLILDDVCRYFNRDVEEAAKKLTEEQYYDFYEKFEDKDFDDYLSEMVSVFKDMKNDYSDL